MDNTLEALDVFMNKKLLPHESNTLKDEDRKYTNKSIYIT